MNSSRRSTFKKKSRAGFTLLELFVVTGTLAVLALLLLPALAGTKPNSQAAWCQNNTRQLALAWDMYASDNQDNVPGVNSYGGTGNAAEWEAAWCGGVMDDYLNCIDTDPITDGELWKYTKNISIYHCPCDISTQGEALSPPVIKGALRLRSYSCSQTFTPANWLPSPTYRSYSKTTQIPSTANTWVFIEENPFSINDGAFAVEMTPPGATTGYLIDRPATYHNGATSLSFADGHSIIHKWMSPLMLNSFVDFSSSDPIFLQDVEWFSSVTSVHE